MKPLVVIGVVVALLGVAMLGYEYLLREGVATVIDTAALRVETEPDRTIPTIAAIVAIVAGIGLAIAGQRRI